MRKKYCILLLFAFVSLNAFAQQAIKLEEVKDHVGDSVKLTALDEDKYLQQVKRAAHHFRLGRTVPATNLPMRRKSFTMVEKW